MFGGSSTGPPPRISPEPNPQFSFFGFGCCGGEVNEAEAYQNGPKDEQAETTEKKGLDPVEKGQKGAVFAINKLQALLKETDKTIKEAWATLRAELDTQKIVWASPAIGRSAGHAEAVALLQSKLETAIAMADQNDPGAVQSLIEALAKSKAADSSGGPQFNKTMTSTAERVVQWNFDQEARTQLMELCSLYKDKVGRSSGQVFVEKGMTQKDVENLIQRCNLSDSKLSTHCSLVVLADLSGVKAKGGELKRGVS